MTPIAALAMSDKPTVAKEAEIDLRLEDLIGKIVRGDATEADRYKLEILSRQRSRLMEPSVFQRLMEIKKRKVG
jgi:hypothetical protein